MRTLLYALFTYCKEPRCFTTNVNKENGKWKSTAKERKEQKDTLGDEKPMYLKAFLLQQVLMGNWAKRQNIYQIRGNTKIDAKINNKFIYKE